MSWTSRVPKCSAPNLIHITTWSFKCTNPRALGITALSLNANINFRLQTRITQWLLKQIEDSTCDIGLAMVLCTSIWCALLDMKKVEFCDAYLWIGKRRDLRDDALLKSCCEFVQEAARRVSPKKFVTLSYASTRAPLLKDLSAGNKRFVIFRVFKSRHYRWIACCLWIS